MKGLAALVACVGVASSLRGQTSPPATRIWHADERAFITDLSVVTAVAATRNVVYAAVPNALAVYDRGFRTWKETVSTLDGFPPGRISAMAANPEDDTVWLAGSGQWLEWSPFGRRLESGGLPGFSDAVVLDARDPSRGAYFHTAAGWYFVARGSLAAEPARDLPPLPGRVGGLSYEQLRARLPALDAVRFRFQRDEQLRDYRLSAAAVVPVTNEIYVATEGNGVFEVDPLTYAVQPLPRGTRGSAIGAVASSRGEVCAAADARAAGPHRGITCFDESLRELHAVEMVGLAGLPGTRTRRLLLTPRAIFAATDQGLARWDRRSGRVQLLERGGLPSNDVLALAAASEGAWVGTSAGLALVSDTGRAMTVERSFAGGPVLALASARDTLWAGTPAGLAVLPPLGEALLLVAGPAPLREPIVALVHPGELLVAATATRFVLRAGEEWRVVDVPGRPVGRITAMAHDTAGALWVAGEEGFAYFEPSRPLWYALTAPGDVPRPVRDVAASRDYVWVATDAGLVRYERRVLLP